MFNTAYAFVVLIDPGHGGEELGAIAKVKKVNSKGKSYTHTVYEKDLNLILAKRLYQYLKKDYSVYLTRSFDRTVTLEQRAQMAETVKADLFISIHFNSTTDKSSHGFETFYLDNHNDKAIHKVEKIENKGLDKNNKIINQILIDLVIQKTAPDSKKLAKHIQKHLNKGIKKKFSMRDRGIKPGLFYVLALSKRPGVLIEAGFMSNPQELLKVHTNNFLDAYAKSMAKGIKDFYQSRPKRDIPLF